MKSGIGRNKEAKKNWAFTERQGNNGASESKKGEV